MSSGTSPAVAAWPSAPISAAKAARTWRASITETEKPSRNELEILRALVPSEASNVAELIPSTADLD